MTDLPSAVSGDHKTDSSACSSQRSSPNCTPESSQIPAISSGSQPIVNPALTCSTLRVWHHCPECHATFGKSDKLERHLQRHHTVALSLPSDVLTERSVRQLCPKSSSPASSEPPDGDTDNANSESKNSLAPLEVNSVLTAAVAEANAAFDAQLPVCRFCFPSRPFATRKDLAKHFVAKHARSMCNSAPSASSDVVMPATQPSSARSSIVPNAKVNKDEYNLEDVKALPKAGSKSGLKRKISDSSSPSSTKRVRWAEKSPAGDVNGALATPSKEPVSVSPVSNGARPPLPPKVGSPVRAETPAKSMTPQVPPAPRVPKAPGGLTAPILDFSLVGGFFSNSHKSYYRAVDP